MRKNIFLKSMLRQPIRTGLLVLLIGLASFSFFLRTMEFVTVRAEITALGGNFRTIGTVDAPEFWADVSAAAEILENSPFVRHVDRIMGAEAILMNMHSPDISGRWHSSPHHEDGWAQTRETCALIIATVRDVEFITWGLMTPGMQIREWTQIIIDVEQVLAGFPAHVVEGQRLTWEISDYVLESMQESIGGFDIIGETFLFRSTFTTTFGWFGEMMIPRPGQDNWGLNMATLSATNTHAGDYEDRIWTLPHGFLLAASYDPAYEDEEIVWVMPAYRLQAVNNDFSQIPEIAHIGEHIDFLNHHQHGIYLQPVRDMTALPIMQPQAALRINWPLAGEGGYLFLVRNGRMLDYDDYINANPVAVVSTTFAFYNRLELGDILEVKIPLNQQVERIQPEFRDIIIRSTPGEYHYQVLELEIVGTYFDFARTRGWGSFDASFLYLPASLMPEGLAISPPEYAIPGWDSYDYLPSIWLSFELADTREEQAFMDNYAPIFAALGLNLMIFEARSQAFWSAVDPMLMVITFNAVVFWVVLILVLALVVFLFLQQRRREMAIQRGLGFASGRLLWQLVVCALCFGMPIVLIGGLLGWQHGIRVTDYTLLPLVEIMPGYEPAVSASAWWFAAMAVLVVGLLLTFVTFGVHHISKWPVLEQLQGVKGRPKKGRSKKPAADKVRHLPSSKLSPVGHHPIPSLMPAELLLPREKLTQSFSQRVASRFRFTLRHILRSPAKSALSMLIALFFVMVLGWLTESILRSEESIDRLYADTIVYGEVTAANAFLVGDIIRRGTIESIIDSGYVENLYIEAGHFRAFLVPPCDAGSLPEDWYDIIGFDREQHIFYSLDTLDFIFAFNDVDLFMARNYIEGIGGVYIEYAPGFAPTDFVHNQHMPIPVIISEYTAQRRGVGLGDEVIIAYTQYSPRSWDYSSAIVIGIHNDNISREAAQSAILLPTDTIEEILGHVTMYTTLLFTVIPYYNRQLEYVYQYLHELVNARGAGIVPLALLFADQLLHTLVGVASQTLLLLELVYPVALGASAVIAGGLAMLLMLQTAKKAAIMHVLGTNKIKTMAMLLIGEVIICLAGMVPALAILAMMGVNFSPVFLASVVVYFSAVVIGATLGVMIIVRRKPLELLQVRE